MSAQRSAEIVLAIGAPAAARTSSNNSGRGFRRRRDAASPTVTQYWGWWRTHTQTQKWNCNISLSTFPVFLSLPDSATSVIFLRFCRFFLQSFYISQNFLSFSSLNPTVWHSHWPPILAYYAFLLITHFFNIPLPLLSGTATPSCVCVCVCTDTLVQVRVPSLHDYHSQANILSVSSTNDWPLTHMGKCAHPHTSSPGYLDPHQSSRVGVIGARWGRTNSQTHCADVESVNSLLFPIIKI